MLLPAYSNLMRPDFFVSAAHIYFLQHYHFSG